MLPPASPDGSRPLVLPPTIAASASACYHAALLSLAVIQPMNLLKALAAVSSMTLLSRVLGFLRDAIIARAFGAGMATDAFFVAFKLPNLLRRVFAEGAFSQAFVPILAEYRSKQGDDATRTFVAHIAGALALALLVVTLLGILAAPAIIWVSAPGFAANADKFALTSNLLRLTFPYILLISLSSLAGSVLNSYSNFTVPAFVPTLLNVAFIGCSLLLAPWLQQHGIHPVYSLAVAVLLGGVLQLVWQFPALARIGMLFWPRLALRDSAVWRVIKQMGPAILGVSVAQVSLIINTIFASFLKAGSVSWMYYADRLMEFPTGMLGVALGTILLPSLSRLAASADNDAYSALLDWGLRLCLLLALPATVALAVIAEPLVSTLFQYGAFSAHDAQMTERALIAYSVGLLGLIMVKVLAPGFYARQDIKTPVRIAMITLALTQVFNLLLISPLQHAGLALAISLGACCNSALLFHKLRQQGIYQPLPGWGRFAGKLLLAVLGMAIVLWLGKQLGAGWIGGSWLDGGLLLRTGKLTALVVVGAGSYFALLFALGFRLGDFKRRAS